MYEEILNGTLIMSDEKEREQALLKVKENQIKEPWSTFDLQLLTEEFLLQVMRYCAEFGRLSHCCLYLLQIMSNFGRERALQRKSLFKSSE